MAALIRLAGETDEEFNRRARPLMQMLSTDLYRRQIAKVFDNNNAFARHLRVAELRRSCGVKDDGVFRWNVEVNTPPTKEN